MSDDVEERLDRLEALLEDERETIEPSADTSPNWTGQQTHGGSSSRTAGT